MSDHIGKFNVLRVLQHGLYCKAEKCHFYNRKSSTSATSFLLMDFEWIRPQNFGCSEFADTKESPGLAGFIGIHELLSCPDSRLFYQMTANLTKLFKKDAPFVWGPNRKVFTGSEDCLCQIGFPYASR
ncbi:hypothetical protein BASA83_011563 [Batrachochytrium salamandrivorans]|nr:hypothetical protein BASA83_011563 [Batrachochytrium salamandrivorans]